MQNMDEPNNNNNKSDSGSSETLKKIIAFIGTIVLLGGSIWLLAYLLEATW